MANAHLTIDPVTKHLVRNHSNVTFYGNTRAKNLRLGRWHFLTDINNDRACTSYTVETSAGGLYANGATLQFNSSRMQTAINTALSASFVASNLLVGLDFQFYQSWDAFTWDEEAWIIPPNFYWFDYASATCVRYKYAVPAALQTGDVQKIFIAIPSMGLTTVQHIDYMWPVGDGWDAAAAVESYGYLSTTAMGFDVLLSSTPTSTPNTTVGGLSYHLRIPINTGTNKMNESPVVPVQYDPNPYTGGVWSNPGDTGGRYIQLDISSDAAKALFSGSYVYVVLKPYFSSYPFMGSIRPYSGAMYPNTASVCAWMNNKTIAFGQSMTAGMYGGPQLGVYSK
jgi:hypothetical protein